MTSAADSTRTPPRRTWWEGFVRVVGAIVRSEAFAGSCCIIGALLFATSAVFVVRALVFRQPVPFLAASVLIAPIVFGLVLAIRAFLRAVERERER